MSARGGGRRNRWGARIGKVYGAYGRDTLNDNGELLLSFANNHDLALVKTFFSTPEDGISYTFNERGKERIDYILMRQRDRKLVRNVTVHPQPSSLPISYHNIMSVPVKLLGHFALNRRWRPQLNQQWIAGASRLTLNFDRRLSQLLEGTSE